METRSKKGDMVKPEPLKGKEFIRIEGVSIDGSATFSEPYFLSKDVKSAVQGLLKEIDKWINAHRQKQKLRLSDADKLYHEGAIDELEDVKTLIKKWLADVVMKDENLNQDIHR